MLVLVDGANLRGHLQCASQPRIDAAAFMSWCRAFGRPAIRWFAGAYPGTEAFFARLRSAGIEVVSKAPKTLPGGARKADMDMEMGLAAASAPGRFGKVLLVTADGDFVPVVRLLRSQGVEVLVLAPRSRVARELLDALDEGCFLDLDAELSLFGFDPGEAA